MKKLTAILLSLCMIASLATVASAEGTPTLTFTSPADDATVAEGEPITLTASLSDGDDVSSVAFKLGTKTIKNFEPTDELSCEIVQLDAGEYTFTAEATNALGDVVASHTASVTVESDTNTAPIITTSIDDASVIYAQSLSAVQANFEDADGIAAVKAYLNGTNICDKARVTSVSLDLSEYAVAGDNELKIVVSDRYGKEASLTKTFKAVLNEGEFLKIDFENVTSRPGDIKQFNGGGGSAVVADPADSDEKCLRYYYTDTANADPVNLGIITEASTSVSYILDCKIRFKNLSKFYFTARPGTGGADYEYLSYNADGTITINGSGGTLTTDTDLLTYAAGKWYSTKLVLKVDTTGGKTTFDYYVDGKAVVTGRSISSTATGISYIKWRLKEVAGEMYIDDIALSYVNDLYVINSVSSSEGGSTVDGNTTTLYATLSKDILSSDITDLVTLKGEMGDITVDSAIYDTASKTVVITIADPLKFDENYVLTIGGDVLYHDSIKAGRDVVARFKTDYADFGITATSYTFEDGSLCFNATIGNSGESVEVVGVTTVWEEDTLVGIYANKASIASPSANVKVTAAPLLTGQRVESYVFHSDLSTPVSVKTFE